jgi:hypothetical protein
VATTREYKGRDGFSVNINPTGFRSIKLLKCKIFGWFPYLSGRDVRFRVSLKNKSVESIPYEWRLSCRDIQYRFWVRGDANNPLRGQMERDEREKVIDIGFLFDMGQYSFQMRWKDEITTGDDFQDVLYFSVEDNDFYISRLLQTLASGVIGAILGALIALGITQ